MSLRLLFCYFVLVTFFSWLNYDYTTNSKLLVLVLFIIGNIVDAHSTAFLSNRDTNGYFRESSYLIRRAMKKCGATKGVIMAKLLLLPFCYLFWLNPSAG